MRERIARLIAGGTALALLLSTVGFAWLQQQRGSELDLVIDVQAWAQRYPLHAEAYLRSALDDAEPEDKLASNPFRRRAWAGHPFATEYTAARGHYFAQIDQRRSQRTLAHDQPAGCIHCHAAEAPSLLATYGADALHALRYDDIRDQLHHGSSCADCHDPRTMALRITRPALRQAMQEQGVDISQASRQEMRSYVCAQCHVEYYFEPGNNALRFPWSEGLRLEDIERHFDEREFADWTHAETGAPLIKVQHPNFELHQMSVHARLGVSCADCHMPKVASGGVLITEHWIRSPMQQVQQACMHCHQGTDERLVARSAALQQRTAGLLAEAEDALSALMDAIVMAADGGAEQGLLAQARQAQRGAQLRWDFVDADASYGFHAAAEARRLLEQAREQAEAGVVLLSR